MSPPQLVHDVRAAVVVRRDRLIRLNEVLRLASVGKSTWYYLMAQGLAPKCVRVTPRCVAWSEAAVLSWVQDRLAQAQESADDTSVTATKGGAA